MPSEDTPDTAIVKRSIAVFGMRFEIGARKSPEVSRLPDYTDTRQCHAALDAIFGWQLKDPELSLGLRIITGGSKGVEMMTNDWCRKYKIECHIIRPDTSRHSSDQEERLRAFDVRNSRIISECTEMLLLWDGKERYLLDLVEIATSFGKTVTIIPIQQY